jgi:hypothetical protein
MINRQRCFGMIMDTFSPKIVGELNGQRVLLVQGAEDSAALNPKTSEHR